MIGLAVVLLLAPFLYLLGLAGGMVGVPIWVIGVHGALFMWLAFDHVATALRKLR